VHDAWPTRLGVLGHLLKLVLTLYASLIVFAVAVCCHRDALQSADPPIRFTR